MKVSMVVLGLVQWDGRWFLQRRDLNNPMLPGRWEFPGGKASEAETLEQALRRELEEELGWNPRSCTPLEAASYGYPDRVVRLHPFRCEGHFTVRTHLSWGWFTVEEMRALPIPEANRALLEILR